MLSMSKFKSLKDLGLKDKRVKISADVKKSIKEYVELNVSASLKSVAEKFGVSIMTVRMIKNPDKEKATIKRSLEKLGGCKHYQDSATQKALQKDCYDRKMKRIRELRGE